MSLWSAVILLVLVMDPLGNVPVFIAALAQVEPRRRIRVLARELLIALALLLGFLFLGRPLLEALGIGGPALGIAGGLVLFLIALRMIFPPPEHLHPEEPPGEPFIVPLAVPLVAGPSALATVLLLVARDPRHPFTWGLALLLAWGITSLLLLFALPIGRFLGERGLAAMERLMGLVLTTVAVQMFLTGLRAFLSG